MRTYNGLSRMPEARVDGRREVERGGPVHGYFGLAVFGKICDGKDVDVQDSDL